MLFMESGRGQCRERVLERRGDGVGAPRAARARLWHGCWGQDCFIITILLTLTRDAACAMHFTAKAIKVSKLCRQLCTDKYANLRNVEKFLEKHNLRIKKKIPKKKLQAYIDLRGLKTPDRYFKVRPHYIFNLKRSTGGLWVTSSKHFNFIKNFPDNKK